MSLNARQIEQTRIELLQNYELLGFSLETIAQDLGFRDDDFNKALELVPHHNPTNVWKLRDYLEKKILEQGKQPVPFTVLTKNIYYPY